MKPNPGQSGEWIQDITREPKLVAWVDFDSAPMMVHEKAVYMLNADGGCESRTPSA